MRIVKIKHEVYPSGRSLVKGRKTFVGISINNSVMQSDTLPRKIFEWTEHNVGQFDILIGDYLHRHNYKAFTGASEELAAERAMEDGLEALKRLSPLISPGQRFFGTTAISTATLIARTSVIARRCLFEDFYEKRSDFRALIDVGVDAFLSRKHPLSLRDMSVRRQCVCYQLEELAMFEELAEEGYGVLVYPGAQLPVMKGLVAGKLPRISPLIQTLQLVELRLLRE
jgi:tRNA-dependent cyclodipeptide synthase